MTRWGFTSQPPSKATGQLPGGPIARSQQIWPPNNPRRWLLGAEIGTSAVARPANVSATRAGVAEARRDLAVTVDKDDDQRSRRDWQAAESARRCASRRESGPAPQGPPRESVAAQASSSQASALLVDQSSSVRSSFCASTPCRLCVRWMPSASVSRVDRTRQRIPGWASREASGSGLIRANVTGEQSGVRDSEV